MIILPGDWGEVTHQLTKKYGTTFAVLNMANAHVPGGGYLEGSVAQEENMFRRTDCHFSIGPAELGPDQRHYPAEMTDLLNARGGRVYLDLDPRVCVRGPEDRHAQDLGYPWLNPREYFPFYELRAAAVDLRDPWLRFDPAECRRRIDAQLDTLIEAKQRYAVLSAHGCGAFRNPTIPVAQAYRDALAQRRDHFDLVVFAIFYAGYGPDNAAGFEQVFSSP